MFAGLFIERHQIVVSLGEANSTLASNVTPTILEGIPVEDRDGDAALDAAVAFIVANTPHVEKVGVGAYGPFVSLDRSDRSRGTKAERSAYGLVHESADPPFRNIPLHGRLTSLFKKHQRQGRTTLPTEIIVQTDANAAALGEACYTTTKQVAEGRIIVYLFVSSRIGGGVVKGRQIHETTLHPEIGLMLGHVYPDDTYAVIALAHFPTTLSDLACIPALLERSRHLKGPTSFEGVLGEPRHKVWKIEADYLAQACYNLAVILAPSQIVIGGPLTRLNPHLMAGIKTAFRLMFQSRSRYPRLEYDALLSPDFLVAERCPDSPYIGPLVMAAIADPIAAGAMLKR